MNYADKTPCRTLHYVKIDVCQTNILQVLGNPWSIHPQYFYDLEGISWTPGS